MRSSQVQQETTKLESPIDGMYLLHKSFRAQAVQLQKEVELVGSKLPGVISLQPIRLSFDTWAASLAYHAEMEDKHLTGGLQEFPIMKDNEISHRKLEAKVEDVFKCLNEEIGKQALAGPTWRHLYFHVIGLRVVQNDHLEEEEEFILPIIRERLTETEQLKIMQYLLIDQSSDNPSWMVDSTARFLTEGERALMDSLVSGTI